MMNPFKRTYTPYELKYFDFLAKNKLFERLNKKEMLPFLPYLHLRKYPKNEAIFFRNDPSQALYLIKKGQVALEMDIKDHFETIVVVEDHVALGHNALLNNSRRLYNAIVRSDSALIYVIPQVNIQSIFDRHAIIKAKMLESLAEIINENFGILFSSYKDTHGFFDLEEVFREVQHGC